jgi:hypothetical protein
MVFLQVFQEVDNRAEENGEAAKFFHIGINVDRIQALFTQANVIAFGQIDSNGVKNNLIQA